MSPRRRHCQGLSLTEVLIALAITVILLGQALPTLRSMLDRRALEAAAAQLETDLQLARAEAVARNEVLRLDVVPRDDGSARCYVLHDGPAGACRCGDDGAAVCGGGASAIRSVGLPASAGPALHSNVASMAFDATKGTVTPTATLRWSNAAGELRLVVNVMGRIRSCTPDGAVAGLKAC